MVNIVGKGSILFYWGGPGTSCIHNGQSQALDNFGQLPADPGDYMWDNTAGTMWKQHWTQKGAYPPYGYRVSWEQVQFSAATLKEPGGPPMSWVDALQWHHMQKEKLWLDQDTEDAIEKAIE